MELWIRWLNEITYTYLIIPIVDTTRNRICLPGKQFFENKIVGPGNACLLVCLYLRIEIKVRRLLGN